MLNLKRQLGVTLFEAILAAAVAGWVMAFIGSELLRYSSNKAKNEAAKSAVEFIETVINYSETVAIPTLGPQSDGNHYTVNPLYLFTFREIYGIYGRAYYSGLDWLRSSRCTGGTLPADTVDTYVACNYTPGSPPFFTYMGTYIYILSSQNIMYPTITTEPSYFHTYFMANSNYFDEFIDIAMRLPEVVLPNGFRIKADEILFAQFSRWSSTSSAYIGNLATRIELADVLSDANGIENLRTTSQGWVNWGLVITIDLQGGKFLRSDGETGIEKGRSLCWESRLGTNLPCISATTNTMAADEENSDNAIMIDANILYGNEIKRSPPEISYHTFTNGEPLEIPYLNCPINTSSALVFENKMAAAPSSFSSGSEVGTNFTDSSNIISTGTSGAGGSHTYVTGLSLEWTAQPETLTWLVEGAVGIDGAFSAANNDSAVLRNPAGISFAIVRWCEQI